VCSAPAVSHQVDRLGRVTGEDHFFGRGGVDEGRHALPGRLIGCGRLLTDGVDAAVRIRVVAPVVVVHGVDDHGGLLRGRGAIQVDERLAVHAPPQDGEVGARSLRVQRTGLYHAGWPSFIRSATETDSRVDVM